MLATWGLLLLLAPDLAASSDAAPEQRDPLCGAKCLYVALKGLDFDIKDYSALQVELGDPGKKGYSLGQLQEVAQERGAQTLGVQTTLDNLFRRRERLAFIAYLNPGHFVLLTDIKPEGISVIDPPRSYVMPRSTLLALWDGTGLLISPEPLASEESLRPSSLKYWLIGAAVCVALLGVSLWLLHLRSRKLVLPH